MTQLMRRAPIPVLRQMPNMRHDLAIPFFQLSSVTISFSLPPILKQLSYPTMPQIPFTSKCRMCKTVTKTQARNGHCKHPKWVCTSKKHAIDKEEMPCRTFGGGKEGSPSARQKREVPVQYVDKETPPSKGAFSCPLETG